MNTFTDRHGRRRWYYRRNGWSIPLPNPDSKDFETAYADAVKRSEVAKNAPVVQSKRGTLDYVRDLYYASADFNNLAHATRRQLRYVVDALCNRTSKTGVRYGEGNAARIRRKDVLKWRDDLKGRPGAGNNLVRCLSQLFNFAVSRELMEENPAKGIKPLKVGEFRDWTDDELLQFEKTWPLGTTERLGYALALYTAQRRQDLVKARWSDIEGGGIWVTQNKTHTRIWIPMHPELKSALDAIPELGRGKTIIAGNRGRPLNCVYFGHIMSAAIDAAKLPKDIKLHGLRKTSARIIAEVGGSVSSITGHLSPQMEKKYAKRADQRRNAVVAINAWGERTRLVQKK